MKHGLYSDALTEEERHDLPQAETMTGLDEEIALLRLKLKRAAKLQPDNLAAIIQAVEAIARTLIARHRITGDSKKGLDEALSRMLTELSNELGATQ